MKQETIEYLRGRVQAERAAVLNAACEEARAAHQQMAEAYARRLEIEELNAAGKLPPGRVTSIAEGLRRRDQAVGRGPFAGSGGAPLTLLPPLSAREGQR
jgi:hypothetical protein